MNEQPDRAPHRRRDGRGPHRWSSVGPSAVVVARRSAGRAVVPGPRSGRWRMPGRSSTGARPCSRRSSASWPRRFLARDVRPARRGPRRSWRRGSASSWCCSSAARCFAGELVPEVAWFYWLDRHGAARCSRSRHWSAHRSTSRRPPPDSGRHGLSRGRSDPRRAHDRRSRRRNRAPGRRGGRRATRSPPEAMTVAADRARPAARRRSRSGPPSRPSRSIAVASNVVDALVREARERVLARGSPRAPVRHPSPEGQAVADVEGDGDPLGAVRRDEAARERGIAQGRRPDDGPRGAGGERRRHRRFGAQPAGHLARRLDRRPRRRARGSPPCVPVPRSVLHRGPRRGASVRRRPRTRWRPRPDRPRTSSRARSRPARSRTTRPPRRSIAGRISKGACHVRVTMVAF